MTSVSTVPAGSVDEAAGFDGCDEGFVNRRVDGVLDDGFGGIHFGTANGWVLLGMGGEGADSQGGDG
jgi:hypothetical protein